MVGRPVAFGALGEPAIVSFAPGADAFALVRDTASATLMVDAQEWPGVQRAARDLQADVERVTNLKPAFEVVSSANARRAPVPAAVLIGTVGHSALIDRLAREGKLDLGAIRGRWESWLTVVVAKPLPGIDRALVIAGSDKRGTIYGVYDLSEQIGVSPWYWWADVPVAHRDALFVAPGRAVHGSPTVKYRGIFLNDEAPDLTNWVRAKFGTAPVREIPPVPAGIANYGHEFYTKLFELILRLRGNYLWPAMWNNAFNEDDADNARLADEYGVVMGTSHQEPMLRAQKEWDRRFLRTIGAWNYAKEPAVLEDFWREGVRRNRAFESIVTMGLRGANDTPMASGGPEANRALLEKIVARQREILREEVNADVTRVPQLWCLYKEVQDYYEAGMRAPDDVTLLWAEDNWGNIRRLPTAEERARPGGAGIYYHFDYHGGPRSYQWLNTSPLPKIWEQMSLAKSYGADRIWIVNVGHFKGYEVPTEFFLRFGWNTNRWNGENLGEFTRLWAAREFGAERAAEIAAIVDGYAKFNGRRKPELLAPDTYSLVDYREAETVVADFNALAARAEKLFGSLAPGQRDAFDELVLFPTRASALVNELYLAAGRNALFARQGRASAGTYAAEVKTLFQRFLDLVAHYHREIAGGKWDHFMDQPVLGYTSWRDPPANTLNHLKLVTPEVPEPAKLGVAVEGAAEAAGVLRLPRFDPFGPAAHTVEIFNQGRTEFGFTAAASAPWIVLDATHGTIGPDRRIEVRVDWARAPRGVGNGRVTISGAGAEVSVAVEAFNPTAIARESLDGFVESDGVIAIEPEHFDANLTAGATRWSRIAGYGRTVSGLRAEAPVDAPPMAPGGNSPHLEYKVYAFTSGPVVLTAMTAPTLNFIPGRAVRYAASFDDEPPQVVTLVPQDYRAQNGNRAWEKSVSDSAHLAQSKHTLATPGYHTLKLWIVDPAVVLQKLVIDLGGLKPSYLGPPESFRGRTVASGKEKAVRPVAK